jgi:hypothetical protein
MIFNSPNYFIFADARVGSNYLRNVLRSNGYVTDFPQLGVDNPDEYCNLPIEVLQEQLIGSQPFAIKIRANTYSRMEPLVEQFEHTKIFLYRKSITEHLRSWVSAIVLHKWVWQKNDFFHIDLNEFEKTTKRYKMIYCHSMIRFLNYYAWHRHEPNILVLSMEDVISIPGSDSEPTPQKIYENLQLDLSEDKDIHRILTIANKLGFEMGL